eukprot:SAG31_NODE_229_length_19770_cov_9.887194_16_plen_74_part_00
MPTLGMLMYYSCKFSSKLYERAYVPVARTAVRVHGHTQRCGLPTEDAVAVYTHGARLRTAMEAWNKGNRMSPF